MLGQSCKMLLLLLLGSLAHLYVRRHSPRTGEIRTLPFHCRRTPCRQLAKNTFEKLNYCLVLAPRLEEKNRGSVAQARQIGSVQNADAEQQTIVCPNIG